MHGAPIESVRDALRPLLGADRARVVDAADPRYAPHPTPLVHALPRTRDEVVEIVRAAARDGFPVVPVGGNTSPRVGASSDRRSICLLSLELLDRVVAFEPGDQTLTAEAGLAVATADDLARPHAQFLAFDPPDPARATLGGTVAAATEGAYAARRGAVRDQLLGVVAVTGDGKLAKAGGRVVKNVTGYDLCRLYAGSRGALAILVELTVRLRPIPETAARAVFRAASEAEALSLALRLRRTVHDVAQLHVLTGAASEAFAGDGAPRMVLTLEGFASAVEAAGRASEAALGAEAEAFSAAPPARAPVATPTDAPSTCVTAPIAAWPELLPRLVATEGPATGVCFDVLRGARTSWRERRETSSSDATLDRALREAGAGLDFPHDPAAHLDFLSRFPGQAPGGLDLMRRLKAAFDPAGILNPGRTIFG
jgi:glycolate oxidase FAD binding subunit